ncbi:MAG: N-acetylglucosamine-6-phosphate deacetylase [Clostridia bacterium]|nr:N-acetylglucosamine-6-phosphate deacetylase [Clostridia bacterium]
MKAFEQANVYLTGNGIVRCNLVFDGTIRSIGDDVGDAQVIDLPKDALVLPGFIDVHVHGAGAQDTMDANTDALFIMSETLAKEGTTSYLATTMSQTEEKITAALLSVKKYRSMHSECGARLIGVHLEGPYLATKRAGAQAPENILAPSIEEFDRYYAASGECIRIVSLAPERNGALGFIRHLRTLGITPSIGHTDAGHDDIRLAMEAGACSVTHTYNAQSPLHHRDIGAVGCALLYDELYTELIADTIHVSVPAMRLLCKNKPHDKVVLITDAMRAKGLGNCESELGGQTVIVKNGEARLLSGALAGSVLPMNRAVANMVNVVGIPLAQAVDYATKNPATLLGMYDRIGSIATGKCADFTVVDPDLNVLYTVRGGKIVYDAKGDAKNPS